MATAAPIYPRAKAILAAAWAGKFISYLLLFSYGVLLPDLKREFSLTIADTGYLSSINYLVQIGITVAIGAMTARIRPKLMIGGACIGLAAAAFCLASAFGAWQLYLGRVLLAVAGASFIAPLVLVKTDWIPQSRLSKINSYESFFDTFGQVTGTTCIAALSTMLGGWRAILAVFGALAAAVAATWFKVYKARKPAPQFVERVTLTSIGALRQAARIKTIWLLGIGWPGTSLVWTAFLTFWPLYAVQTIGFTIAQAGVAIGMIPIASCIANLATPYITDWIGYDKLSIWPWGFILPVFYYLVMHTSNFYLLCCYFFVCGYGAYAFVPICFTTLYKLPGIAPQVTLIGVSVIRVAVLVGNVAAGLIVGLLGESIGLYNALLLCSASPIIFGISTLFIPELGRCAQERTSKNDLTE